MMTLLDAVRPETVTPRPFPYVTQGGVLDGDLCCQLVAEFPSSETIANGKPLSGLADRFTLQTVLAMTHPGVSSLWKAFIASHVTRDFYLRVLDVFAPVMLREHPRLEAELGPLRTLRVGTRGVQSFDEADVLLDANLCINTPDPVEAAVRIAHVDQPTKLFVGLWYLKPDADQSTGGHLELYAYADETPVPLRNRRLPIDERVTRMASIPYERNRLVFWVNTRRGMHARSPRSASAYPRMFVNLIGWVRAPLFEVS